jgi:tRNA threonylcarbamoyladenosine biosynthesis protein TsaB
MAYAAPHLAEDETVPVVAAIDARHDHVYLQVFGSGGRTLTAPRLAPLRDAVRAAAETSARIVGSAAEAVAAGLSADDPAPVSIDGRVAPDIGWVARVGAAIPPDTSTPPKPQYLRAPDAQPQNAAQLPRR